MDILDVHILVTLNIIVREYFIGLTVILVNVNQFNKLTTIFVSQHIHFHPSYVFPFPSGIGGGNSTEATSEVDALASKYDAAPDAAVESELAALKAKLGVTSSDQ